MEIIDNNKIVIDIYKYEELVSELTRLRQENYYKIMENNNIRDLLNEKDRIIEMLKDLIKGSDNNE